MAVKKTSIRLFPKIPYVILCEGIDEKFFLIQYIEYLVKRGIVPDSYNVIDMGGNEELRKNMPIISKLAHYQEMKGFLVLRDAEMDAKGAAISVRQSILRAFSVSIPEDDTFVKNEEGALFGYTLLPGWSADKTYRNGTLEDLCWDIMKNKKNELSEEMLKELSIDYVKRAASLRDKNFRTLHKNKLHAYLSGTDSFVGMKIGEAAQAGCFDFSHTALDFLQEALLRLANRG